MASATPAPKPVRVADIYVTSGFPEFTFVAPGVYSRLLNALAQRTAGWLSRARPESERPLQ